MLYNSAAQKFSAPFDTYTFIDTLFILTSVAEEYKLLHTNCSSFISSPFKELMRSNDSVYNAVLFNEWDIYKNTGEKIFSKLNCDSLKIAPGHGWNIYRNDSLFFRNYSSFYYGNAVKPFVPVGTNHCAAVIDKFDQSIDLSSTSLGLSRACDIMRPAPGSLEPVETDTGRGLKMTIRLFCEADITFRNS